MGASSSEFGIADAGTVVPTLGAAPLAARLLHRAGYLASRVLFGCFLLLTSVYCLLLYIPFTYFGFIQHPLLWWLPTFVSSHPSLYAVLLTAVVATLFPAFRDGRTRRTTIGFVVVNGGAALYFLFRPALGSMLRDLFALIWSMLCLFPLLWLAAIDLARSENRKRGEFVPTLASVTFSAVAVASSFAFIAAANQMFHAADLPVGTLLRGMAASVLLHVSIFGLAGLVLFAFAAVARRAPWPQQTHSTLKFLLAWLLSAEVILRIVLPTVSFDGLQAVVYSIVFSLVLLVYVCAIGRALDESDNVTTFIRRHNTASATVGALVLLAFAYAIPTALASTDWDFVIQKLATILLWLAAFVFCGWVWNGSSWGGQSPRRDRKCTFIAVAFLLVATVGFGVHEVRAHFRPALQAQWNAALETYAGSDISFKTAFDIVSRSVANEAHSSFYTFLRHNTNLAPEAPAAPADTSLVADLKPSPGPKPNIFLFVIDSLRQDYLSPYEPSATFTPEIGNFARDSVVMRNAFTRYAGTALSEPAIWVGALQLHKQYIQPFPPMNNLQKLLDADGYHSYISVDPILATVLHPSSSITELDKQTRFWNDLDFVSTLKELESKIDARSDRQQPIFAYTQPQNVHTLTLERSRQGGSRREISIRECQRMDAAFGDFIRFLKQRGVYDNSIIILTSDHGDSYGEFGRYGHADFLFPEIIRVPLIIHLPPNMRESLVWNSDQIAFSTDITPTLYYLLGHRPINNNELFGRPLLTHTLAEQRPYMRSEYLIASSYAPVYGVLSKGGEALFIVDAVNHRNYFYDLAADPTGIHNRITAEIRDANEPVIRRDIDLIDRFYHHTPSE